MKTIFLILTILNFLTLFVNRSYSITDQTDASPSHNKDCQYEKEPWEECDAITSTQKRILKLKNVSNSAQCDAVKEVTRTCKKVCRYVKGSWSDCLNDEKTRIDTLKKNLNNASDCEVNRITKKKCKLPSSCKYIKSDWSACKKGVKNKTLTLETGDKNECESKKIITKQCAQSKKAKTNSNNRRANRKNKIKKDRNDNKKNNSFTTEDTFDVQ